MNIPKKRVINALLILIILIAAIFVTVRGLSAEKYYVQAGNINIVRDEISGKWHTPYLTLRKGNVRFIIGYNAKEDVDINVGGREEVINKSAGEGEDFKEYVLTLDAPTDLFCISMSEEAKGNIQIYEYELIFDKPYNNDANYIGFLMFLILCLILLAYIRYGHFDNIKKTDILIISIIGAVIVFSSIPVFKDYLTYGHDLMGQTKRIEGLKQALLEGHLIPMVYPGINNGYGELGYCYPYLFLYIPAFLRVLNVSMPLAYGSMILMINIATGMITYCCVKSMTGSIRASVMAACFYLLAPYRLTDLYFRAALGEATAMTFLPLVIGGLYHIIAGNKKKYYMLSVGLIAIFSCHVLTMGLAGIFMIFMVLANLKNTLREKRYIELIKAGVIFLVPAVIYYGIFFIFLPYINLGGIKQPDFYRMALYPAQLFMSEPSDYVMTQLKEGIGNEMVQGVGLSGGLVIIGSIIHMLISKNIKKVTDSRFITAMNICSFIFLYLSTALFPWNYINSKIKIFDTVTGMIQFPFRLLIIVTAVISIEAGLLLAECFSTRESFLVAASVMMVLLVAGTEDIMDTDLRREVYVSDISGGFSAFSHPEYYPEGTDKEMFKNTEPVCKGIQISEYKKKGTEVSLDYELSAGEEAVVELPLLYYPGYTAIDQKGNRLAVRQGDGGRVEVLPDPANPTGSIKVYYSLVHIFM